MKRRKSRIISIGEVKIGGSHPVAIQSMTNTKTHDVKATIKQIKQLQKLGCEIIRVSIPDKQSAAAITEIRKGIDIPFVADIHFDWRMAIESMKMGVDKIRINPGNIGPSKYVEEIIEMAKKTKTPVRIGVNAGSLEKDLWKKYGRPSAEALAESALRWVDFFEKRGHELLVLSLKSSRVPEMVEAYRLISNKCDYPLHLGVTEAGTMLAGSVKNAMGIGILLHEGIGDTIRVSLAEDPAKEIPVCKEILKGLEMYQKERAIIACPSCARTEIDLFKLVKEVEKKTKNLKKPVKIAVMGCVVNGPGESIEADYGVAAGRGAGVIYRKGKIVKTAKEEDLLKDLLTEINKDFPEIKIG